MTISENVKRAIAKCVTLEMFTANMMTATTYENVSACGANGSKTKMLLHRHFASRRTPMVGILPTLIATAK